MWKIENTTVAGSPACLSSAISVDRQSVSISAADAKAIRERLTNASRHGHARVALQELAILGKEGEISGVRQLRTRHEPRH